MKREGAPPISKAGAVDQLGEIFDVPLTELTRLAPDGLLEEALGEARFTPSAANLQPWTFVRLTRPESVRALADNSLNALGLPMPNHRNAALLNVAHLVLVCMNVLRGKCRFGDRGVNLFAIQDVAAATHTARIAAHARGIASHWIRELDFPAVEAALGLTPRLRLQGVIAFGLAETAGLERPPRLDPQHFVFTEDALIGPRSDALRDEPSAVLAVDAPEEAAGKREL